jgi:pimeloyl-ACP methyl ester carboxylesterase
MRRIAHFALLPLIALAPVAASAQTAPAPVAAEATAFASNRISVTTVGTGPDVILIPGLSSSPEVWATTVAAMPGYRYHLVQVKGFAGVAPDANATGPVVAPVAAEIARYISDSRLDRPALVGHSLGGTLAMMVATQHPDSVGRLMVVDMFPFLGAMFGGPTATPDSVRPMAEQIRAGITASSGDGRRAQTEQTIAGMVRTEAMRPTAVRHSLDSDPATSGQAMYDIITTNLMPDLARFRGPFKVLWVVPTGAPVSEEMMGIFYRSAYAAAPQAQLVHIPDSAHFIMWDAPTRFRSELSAFLAAPAPATP